MHFDGEADRMYGIDRRKPPVGSSQEGLPESLALLRGTAAPQSCHDVNKSVRWIAVGDAKIFAPRGPAADADQIRDLALDGCLMQVVDERLDVEPVLQICGIFGNDMRHKSPGVDATRYPEYMHRASQPA